MLHKGRLQPSLQEPALENVLWMYFMDFCNKLECLSLASLSILVSCLWLRPGAYPKLEYLKGASLG